MTENGRVPDHAQRRRQLVLGSYYSGPTVIARGVVDTEPAACKEANEAARKAELID
jgi:hypothetical protein